MAANSTTGATEMTCKDVMAAIARAEAKAEAKTKAKAPKPKTTEGKSPRKVKLKETRKPERIILDNHLMAGTIYFNQGAGQFLGKAPDDEVELGYTEAEVMRYLKTNPEPTDW